MRHKIALAKSALIAAICILPASLFAVTAAELNAFYQAKQYLKCYDAALQASSEYRKSAVPVFYAAIALCHVDEDAALQKAVTQPWGKVLGLTEKAKARDPQGKQLGRYQSGLALIQQKLFEKVNAIYEVGDEGMVSQFQRIEPRRRHQRH